MRKRKVTYPVARTSRRPAPTDTPEVTYVRPSVVAIDVNAQSGREGITIGRRVRIVGGGLYSGEIAVVESMPGGLIPSALVRTEAGRTRRVRTIDLEPVGRGRDRAPGRERRAVEARARGRPRRRLIATGASAEDAPHSGLARALQPGGSHPRLDPCPAQRRRPPPRPRPSPTTRPSRSPRRTRRVSARSCSCTACGCSRTAGNRWAARFEEAGYTAVMPHWPDDPETVAEAKADPGVFAHKGVGQVADHVDEVIKGLTTKPAVIGHSFGGLLAQIDRRPRTLGGDRRHRSRAVPGRAAAADLRAQVGVSPCSPTRPTTTGPIPLTYEQFRYAFANAVEENEAHELYETYAVPASGRAALPGRDRQLQPVDRGQGQDARTPSAARC